MTAIAHPAHDLLLTQVVSYGAVKGFRIAHRADGWKYKENQPNILAYLQVDPGTGLMVGQNVVVRQPYVPPMLGTCDAGPGYKPGEDPYRQLYRVLLFVDVAAYKPNLADESMIVHRYAVLALCHGAERLEVNDIEDRVRVGLHWLRSLQPVSAQ
jgi:hypothetical protein